MSEYRRDGISASRRQKQVSRGRRSETGLDDIRETITPASASGRADRGLFLRAGEPRPFRDVAGIVVRRSRLRGYSDRTRAATRARRSDRGDG